MATKDAFWAPPPGSENLDAAWCLAVLAHAAYQTDDQYVKSWGRALGMASAEVVLTPGILIPNFCFLQDAERVIVAIPGTNHFMQMFHNTLHSAQRDNSAFGPGGIHSFFLWCAEGIVNFIRDKLNTLSPPLKICFVGHSLGGAVAQLLADWTERNTAFEVRYCCTFNSPRVGNRPWARRTRRYPLDQYYNSHDIVCEFPPNVGNVGLSWSDGAGGNLDWEHRSHLVRVESLSTIEASWDVVIGAKVLWPAEWGLKWLRMVPGVDSLREVFGRVASKCLVGSWFLPLPVWFEQHTMWSVCENIAAMHDLGGVRERHDLQILEDALTSMDSKFVTATPTPFALAPPRNFDVGQYPGGGAIADLPAVAPGERTELIEAAFNWLDAPNVGPARPIISVTDAFLDALGRSAQTAPYGNPMFSAVPIEVQFPPRPHWVFRGEDRLILQKAAVVLRLIELRDDRAAGGTPTPSISNRDPIFDPDDAQALDALFLVQGQLDYLLSLAYQ